MGGVAAGVLIKRSFSLAGHRTSVALEAAFWGALERIAAADGVALAALVVWVDRERGGDTPLASALRVMALRRVEEGQGSALDPPGP